MRTNVDALVGTDLRERAQAWEQTVLEVGLRTAKPIGSETMLAQTLAIVQIVGAGTARIRGEHDAVLVAVLRAVALAKFQIELQKWTLSTNTCGVDITV